MAKYEVTIKEIEIYILEDIEATSEADAIEIAYSIMDETDYKNKYHHDSDGEAEAIEIEDD